MMGREDWNELKRDDVVKFDFVEKKKTSQIPFMVFSRLGKRIWTPLIVHGRVYHCVA